MPAAIYYRPFFLIRNRRFDEAKRVNGPKDQGRHQGPTAHGERPSPMSAVARAPYPVERGRSQHQTCLQRDDIVTIPLVFK